MNTKECATIGCADDATVTVEYGPADDRETDGVCADCAAGYARRPALGGVAMSRYWTCVVLVQPGDDYAALEHALYPNATDGSTGWADEAAGLAYLAQWDMGGESECDLRPDAPTTDHASRSYAADGYVMVWSASYGWAGLYRPVGVEVAA